MIILPTEPAPNGATPGLIDFGGFITPALGGEVQRVNRLGTRFAIAVTLPPMPGPDGRVWVSRLIRGKSEGVRMEFPLLDFEPGSPGSPIVNGAGQAGTSLSVRGFAAGYATVEGQWFSLVSGGRHYLHNVSAATAADGAGNATLSIYPMLRISPADGDALRFQKPMIEGFIHGDEWRWQMSVDHQQSIEFEIHEAA